MNYSLISILLGRLRMPVHDAILEYETLGSRIFGKPRFFHQSRFLVLKFIKQPKFSHRDMEAVFRDVCERHNDRTAQSGRDSGNALFELRGDVAKT